MNVSAGIWPEFWFVFVGFSKSSVPNRVNLSIKISPNFLQDLQRVFNQFKDTKHIVVFRYFFNLQVTHFISPVSFDTLFDQKRSVAWNVLIFYLLHIIFLRQFRVKSARQKKIHQQLWKVSEPIRPVHMEHIIRIGFLLGTYLEKYGRFYFMTLFLPCIFIYDFHLI